jgi:hypothetical protein
MNIVAMKLPSMNAASLPKERRSALEHPSKGGKPHQFAYLDARQQLQFAETGVLGTTDFWVVAHLGFSASAISSAVRKSKICPSG